MTLTTRLSVFFLTMLGLVLVTFSAVFYLLARTHLHRQVEERLEAALNTLQAAAEVRPGVVEWEPAERSLGFCQTSFGEQAVWLVRDHQGRVVDRSAVTATAEALDRASRNLSAGAPSQIENWQGPAWKFSQRWIYPPAAPNPQVEAAGEPGAKKFPALALAAGIPLAPTQATLRLIAWVLVGLSSAIWLIALVAGRIVCRRALLPVTRMALSARAMDPSDLAHRLPALSNNDELEDLSRAFNNLLDRLQESFERQRRFTGDASHQLRTPLTAMLGQIEVALRRERSPEEYARVLRAVKEETGRLRRIAESLLFLARTDSDARFPEPEVIDLGAWLPEYVRSLPESDREAGIVLESPGAEPLEVQAQSVLLGELVHILIDNACKYSAAEQPIRVHLSGDEQWAWMAVEDRGLGIAEEDFPSLTKPFFRSADSRRRGIEGVGLGLSIAHRLAKAFGGSLKIVSKVGSGSLFTVKLPRVRTHRSGSREDDKVPAVSCPA